MKKFAVAALSLALLSVLPAAQAATVSVDAGNYVFSYDDSFLTGSIFASGGNVFTFAGLSYLASTPGNELSVASFDGYAGKPYPIVITPKAGYQIVGVTEAIFGQASATAGAGEGAVAGVSAGLVSRWVLREGVFPLGQNTPFDVAAVAVAGGPTVSGNYAVSGSLDFGPAISADNLAPGAVVLSALDLVVNTAVSGVGGSATGSLIAYQIGVRAAPTAPVPEPQSVALLLAGLGFLGYKLATRKGR